MEFFQTYFIDVLKNHYADFNGKADRKQYWYFVLIGLGANIIFSVLGNLGSILSGLYALAVLIPSIALATRRLHDTDKSGYFQLIALIPALGAIVLIILLALPSKSPTRFD